MCCCVSLGDSDPTETQLCQNLSMACKCRLRNSSVCLFCISQISLGSVTPFPAVINQPPGMCFLKRLLWHCSFRQRRTQISAGSVLLSRRESCLPDFSAQRQKVRHVSLEVCWIFLAGERCTRNAIYSPPQQLFPLSQQSRSPSTHKWQQGSRELSSSASNLLLCVTCLLIEARNCPQTVFLHESHSVLFSMSTWTLPFPQEPICLTVWGVAMTGVKMPRCCHHCQQACAADKTTTSCFKELWKKNSLLAEGLLFVDY